MGSQTETPGLEAYPVQKTTRKFLFQKAYDLAQHWIGGTLGIIHTRVFRLGHARG
jgi:hypothetical protein